MNHADPRSPYFTPGWITAYVTGAALWALLFAVAGASLARGAGEGG